MIEGIVAVTAGLLAGLVSLVGFGLDSGIESAAAVLVGLRLAARLRHGEADEDQELRTLRAVAVTFFVLAAYVVIVGHAICLSAKLRTPRSLGSSCSSPPSSSCRSLRTRSAVSRRPSEGTV